VSSPSPSRGPAVSILRRTGNPFEAERMESAPPAREPSHVALLNRLFYDSTVDLGALVRIDGRTYLCTRAGWRVAVSPTEP
jgi:hypothetical protein